MPDTNLVTLNEINNQPEVKQDLNYFRNPDNRPKHLQLDVADISRRFSVSGETLQTWANRPEDSWFKRQYKGLGAGIVRTGQQISDLPQLFKNLGYRYNFPNANEETASKLMEMGLRRQMAIGESRAYHEKYEGTDDSIAANISGAFGSALTYGAVALGASAIGGPAAATAAVGVLAGAQATAETAESYAEEYARRTGDYELKDYDKSADAIAFGYGALSGFIESALGIEGVVGSLFGKTTRRTLVRTATGFAGEATEEALQEFTGGIAGKIAGYEDREWKQIFMDSLEAAVYGGIVGGAMGGSLYYVHRNRLARQFEKFGFNKQESRQLADSAIDDTMNQATKEAFTFDSLQSKLGQPFNDLVGKIETALNSAGWKDKITDPDTGIERDVHEYSSIVASDIAAQTIRQASILNVPVNEVLDLNEIQVDENRIFLKPMELGTTEQIKAQIDEKKAQIKDLTAKSKVMQGDPARKKELQMQVAILDKWVKRKERQEKADAENRQQTLKDMGLEFATKDANSDIKYLNGLKRPVNINNFVKKHNITVEQAQSRLERARLREIVGNDKTFEKLLINPENAKIVSVLQGKNNIIRNNPELLSDVRNAVDRLIDLGNRDFASTILKPTKTVENVFGQNAIMYALKFGEINQVNQFFDIYQAKSESNVNGDTFNPGTFNANDLYAQSLVNTFPESFDENGKAITRDISAVFLSQNNQQVQGNQLFQEQSDLATENARLDAENPAYTGNTINIDGVERTVYNSNGDRIAQSEPALRNFWGWFGNSKVVDDQGRPLVVYHGSQNPNIKKFEQGRPAYFTNDKNLANDFAHRIEQGDGLLYGEIPTVYSVYLYIENPYIIKNHAQYELEMIDTEINKSLLQNQGYDGVVYTENEISYLAVFEPNQIKSTDNRGTFSPDTGNIYYQEMGGLYDPELNVIVLGKDFNTGTLPHEMAHFWLQDIFNRSKADENWTPEFKNQVKTLFDILGVKDGQTNLTTAQHERFARMTEAVVFGLASAPEGTALPQLAYLNWLPPKYKSLQAIRYRDENGKLRYPVLDKAAADFFNAWYANPFMPVLGVDSPEQSENVNPDNQPALPETVAARREKSDIDVKEQQEADADLYKTAQEKTPTNTRASIAAYESENSRKVSDLNAKREEVLNPEKKGPMSFLKFGRRTNTQKGIRTATTDYVKKNKKHAEEIAFGNPDQSSPDFVRNDSGLDRISLIREVMKNYKKGTREYAQLYRNQAIEATLAGKTTGLNNDISFQYYLNGYKKLYAALELRAAKAYAGNKSNAIEVFNRDIDSFIAERVDAILKLEPNSKARNDAIDAMILEAEMQFAGGASDSRLLFQENTLGQSATPKQREAFVAWANKYIKDHLTDVDNKLDESKLITLSDKAQAAEPDLNSPDAQKAIAAAKVIAEWQIFVNSENPPPSFVAKTIGVWSPMAMLLNPNTHVINIVSTSINRGLMKTAMKLSFKYGKKVDTSILDAEQARIKKIFDATLLDYAQMPDPLSPALLHGEKMTIGREGIDIQKGDKLHKQIFKGVQKLTYYRFGKEDFFFRSRAYIEALNYIATRDAKGDATVANQLFKEYARFDNAKKSAAYKARVEAINIANMTTFVQNGKLAQVATKIRRTLNSLTGNPEAGIGTILAPFAKVPANVVEQGAKSLKTPFKLIDVGIRKISGKTVNWGLEDNINAINFGFAAVLGILAGALGDYEPPYDPSEKKKYDPKKPYDSIGIGGLWIKLDTFGALEVPIRIAAMWSSGKGAGFKETLGTVPLAGEFADTWQQAMDASSSGEKALRFGLNFGYNLFDRTVPAIVKQVMSATNLGANLDIPEPEKFDIGVKTGIGRKIGRRYGLDGDDRQTLDYINDILAFGLNRVKITEQKR